ncbi:MAG: DUF5666 domain-containing protein [Candidatus Zixiibacteriota bacterium]
MYKQILGHFVRTLFGLILTAAMIGCSESTPVAPTSTLEMASQLDADCPNCEQVNFAARVNYINQAQLRLAFAGQPDTVVATQNCEMFKVMAGFQVQIQFGDIQIGDSVEVNGQRHANGDVVALRLRIMASDGSCGYDLAFRDSIATIDHVAGTFTVYGRTEVITIDENTVIWGTLTSHQNAALSNSGPQNNQSRDRIGKDRDTLFAFSDLMVGDVVEVRASILDEATLLAVKIKVANCAAKECQTFDAVIAAIDLGNRNVTFVDLDWLGWVCTNAQLIDADGGALLLEDFASGDQVTAKGFPSEDGRLRISIMTLVSPV